MGSFKLYGIILLQLLAGGLHAAITLPSVIGDNMVLERNAPLTIWGQAATGEQVTVKFAGQVKTAIAGSNGNWKVILSPLNTSATDQDLIIGGTNTIILHHILIGEVWLASGQSNMEYEMRKNSKVARPDSTDKNSPVDELDHAHNPMIRIFWVDQKNLKQPNTRPAKWNIAQDSALRSFSAVGYFFAKNLYERLHVPIGIISAAVSGSRIEPWTPAEAYALSPYFKLKANGGVVKIDGDPGKFYHSMIEPLAPFAIKGFLWYQGESNCYLGEAISYTHKMQVLIDAWRNLWADGEKPFYFVQLAPYYYSHAKETKVPLGDTSLPLIREAQTLALKIPNTGMVVTTDLNDDIKNIHPPYKWEVGRRLALLALANTYRQGGFEYQGPVYSSLKITGNKAVLTFTHLGKGLFIKDQQPLNWFSIAGADGKFVQAQATITGNKVVVSSPQVKSPVAVRFAWNEAAQPNLFNRDGLPAWPFRTDNPLTLTSY
jgi:sialate O-acetylesterase